MTNVEKWKLLAKILGTVAVIYKTILIGPGALTGALDGISIYAIWRA